MATFTTNYNLRKPATTDFVTVTTDINDNMDTIDAELKSHDDSITALDGAWTSYTPTVSNWTVGNGTLTGKYRKTGKTVNFRIKLTLGSTTSTAGSPTFELPFAASGDDCFGFAAAAVDTSAGLHVGLHAFNGNTTTVWFRESSSSTNPLTSTIPFTWATGDSIYASGTYEAA